jgi:hypothetical protein
MSKFKEWLKPIMVAWLGIDAGDEKAQAEIKTLQSQLALANDAANSLKTEVESLRAKRTDMIAFLEKVAEEARA